MNDYSVLPRYPNELAISEVDAKIAISYAKDVQEFILNIIEKAEKETIQDLEKAINIIQTEIAEGDVDEGLLAWAKEWLAIAKTDDPKLTLEELELYFELTRARIKYIEEKALARKTHIKSINKDDKENNNAAEVDLAKFESIINKMPPEMQEEMRGFLRDLEK